MWPFRRKGQEIKVYGTVAGAVASKDPRAVVDGRPTAAAITTDDVVECYATGVLLYRWNAKRVAVCDQYGYTTNRWYSKTAAPDYDVVVLTGGGVEYYVEAHNDFIPRKQVQVDENGKIIPENKAEDQAIVDLRRALDAALQDARWNWDENQKQAAIIKTGREENARLLEDLRVAYADRNRTTMESNRLRQELEAAQAKAEQDAKLLDLAHEAVSEAILWLTTAAAEEAAREAAEEAAADESAPEKPHRVRASRNRK